MSWQNSAFSVSAVLYFTSCLFPFNADVMTSNVACCVISQKLPASLLSIEMLLLLLLETLTYNIHNFIKHKILDMLISD